MKKVDEIDQFLLKKYQEDQKKNSEVLEKQKETKKGNDESSSEASDISLDYFISDKHGYLLTNNDNIVKNYYTQYFQYPPETAEQKNIKENIILLSINEDFLKDYCILYKAYKNVPDCIILPMINGGSVRTTSYLKANIIWKLLKTDKMDLLISKLNPYQRYNHFPCTWQIGRKDNLWRNYLIYKIKYPNDFKYMPETYLLPEDNEIFSSEILPQVKIISSVENKKSYILKPVASSRGRGIKLLTPATSIPKKCLVSEYIDNPHIINSKKYDLRLYILITGFSPLKIYLYEEGLVRFASEDYDSENLYNKFMHLTNYSINKESNNFDKNVSTQHECIGSKWSLSALRKYFYENKLDFNSLWDSIKDIVVKACITIEEMTVEKISTLTKYNNCLFELYGFDVLVDSDFRPWLMEVNLNPSLNTDTDLDLKIKSMLMTDIFNIIGIEPYSHFSDKNGNRKGGAKDIKTFSSKANEFEIIMNKANNNNSIQNNNKAGTDYGVFSQNIKYTLKLRDDLMESDSIDSMTIEDDINKGKIFNKI